MEVIAVSGTPGTGKSTYAKRLAKEKGYRYIDVKKLIDEKGLYEDMDMERDSKIVDVDRLNRVLVRIIKEEKGKGLVIDSHLSHFLSKKYVDKVIITKCSLKELKKRLESRGYTEKKVRENMDAEIFDICRVEAQELGHDVEVVMT